MLSDSSPIPLRRGAAHFVPSPETKGRINSVETCGTVDGPGLRYVLFTSGCPLHCLYCHNPETRLADGPGNVTAKECVDEMLRYRNFLRRGGLTITGGEPLAQPEFVHAIFHLAKQAGVHTALDTSGALGNRASDEFLKDVDLVLLDIKSFDPATYHRVTLGEVAPVLEFARRLSDLGKPTWIRFVLVPGLTDAEANMRGLAEFVATLTNVERLEVLPFHKMGESKYEKLGIPYELGATEPPTEEEVARARCLFESYGINVR